MESRSRTSGVFSLGDIPDEFFSRQDESPDGDFYRVPRLVAHIDDPAISSLGEFFRPYIPVGADVLDLMSAYLSHIPPDIRAACHRVAGLGLSGVEMAANAQLTEHVVQSLNDNPALPYPEDTFDTVLCTVSVQYLLRPADVFAEVNRVLRPGGSFLVAFSNRCFPTKATRLWLSTDDSQHVALIQLYFEESGQWEQIKAHDLSPYPGRTDPLYAVSARKPQG